MNFDEIAAASAAQRQALDERVGGKASTPATEDTKTNESETLEEVDLADAEAFGTLTKEEASEVMNRAAAGDETALAILGGLKLETPRPQSGDGGGVGRRGSTVIPSERFNQAVRKALRIGHRRQAERKGHAVLEIGGRPTEL